MCLNTVSRRVTTMIEIGGYHTHRVQRFRYIPVSDGGVCGEIEIDVILRYMRGVYEACDLIRNSGEYLGLTIEVLSTESASAPPHRT